MHFTNAISYLLCYSSILIFWSVTIPIADDFRAFYELKQRVVSLKMLNAAVYIYNKHNMCIIIDDEGN